MKEQVTDISAMLESLTKEEQSMRETIDAQHTEIDGLRRNVDRSSEGEPRLAQTHLQV